MPIQTINEIAREHLNDVTSAALAAFRSSVLPIYGSTERGDPDHIGTGLLLDLSEGKFLLTAAHVLDYNEKTSLYLGAEDFLMLQFDALVSVADDGNRSSDQADFAIACLDESFLKKLSKATFITEAQISRSVASSEGRIYTCLGYPNSKNKVKPFKSSVVTPKLLAYTSFGRPASALSAIASDDFHILVDSGKYARDEAGEKVSATSMHGFSGGAIIDNGRMEPDALEATFEPKLAALFIERHKGEGSILGTRVAAILTAFRQHLKDGSTVSTAETIDDEQ